MVTAFPESPDAFKDATWEDILPFYEALASRPLDRENVEDWLADWSQFESLLTEATALAHFLYSGNTADADREAAEVRFGTQIMPKVREERARLQARLVELGYVRAGLETVVQRFRNQIEIFSEANVPLFSELSNLETEWSKVIGSLTVEWEGQEKTPPQLLPFLESTDRGVRERAFKLRARPYIEKRAIIAGIFDRMYDLRQQVAVNAGFDNHRDYAHREKNRFDYTPDDCFRFQDAVEEVVTPAAVRVLERRRRQMGLDRLRPWDMSVDPKGRAALRPFDDIGTFIDRAANVFGHVDPDFRGYYQSMVDANLLDLENRKGKAPGGYCVTLNFRKLPVIFLNAVGVDGDLRSLLHESGHAFHSIEASRLPLLFQRHPGSEMAEVASMSMELLAQPYIDKKSGGYSTRTTSVAPARSCSRGSSCSFLIARRSTPSSTGCTSTTLVATLMPATPSGSSCALDSKGEQWIGADWMRRELRVGTSSRTSSAARSTTSNMGSRSLAHCRYGGTASTTASWQCGNTARLLRGARPCR